MTDPNPNWPFNVADLQPGSKNGLTFKMLRSQPTYLDVSGKSTVQFLAEDTKGNQMNVRIMGTVDGDNFIVSEIYVYPPNTRGLAIQTRRDALGDYALAYRASDKGAKPITLNVSNLKGKSVDTGTGNEWLSALNGNEDLKRATRAGALKLHNFVNELKGPEREMIEAWFADPMQASTDPKAPPKTSDSKKTEGKEEDPEVALKNKIRAFWEKKYKEKYKGSNPDPEAVNTAVNASITGLDTHITDLARGNKERFNALDASPDRNILYKQERTLDKGTYEARRSFIDENLVEYRREVLQNPEVKTLLIDEVIKKRMGPNSQPTQIPSAEPKTPPKTSDSKKTEDKEEELAALENTIRKFWTDKYKGNDAGAVNTAVNASMKGLNKHIDALATATNDVPVPRGNLPERRFNTIEASPDLSILDSQANLGKNLVDGRRAFIIDNFSAYQQEVLRNKDVREAIDKVIEKRKEKMKLKNAPPKAFPSIPPLSAVPPELRESISEYITSVAETRLGAATPPINASDSDKGDQWVRS